jgi:hypothetical protein
MEHYERSYEGECAMVSKIHFSCLQDVVAPNYMQHAIDCSCFNSKMLKPPAAIAVLHW